MSLDRPRLGEWLRTLAAAPVDGLLYLLWAALDRVLPTNPEDRERRGD